MLIHYNPKNKQKANFLRNHPTYAEKVFWNMVKGKQLGYDFHRQKPIGNFIYDFYCYKLKLLIEIDGISHNDEKVKINDEIKNEYANSMGFKLIRFTDDEVCGNSSLVFDKLKKIINECESNTSSTK